MTDEDIDNCEKAMVPTNMTNFYDTTIDQLDKQGARIERKYSELSKKTRELVPLDTFASVVFAILTDGCDNVSTKYDSKTPDPIRWNTISMQSGTHSRGKLVINRWST